MMRILVTRPEPDAGRLAERLAENGHDVYIEPMIDVIFDSGDDIDLQEVQALIATSRNGVRALAQSPALEIARHLPLYAVGPGTAAAARSSGISNVIAGAKDGRALVQLIAEHAEANGGALLHLAGDRLAFDVTGELSALGFTVLQPVVYHTNAADSFSDELQASLDSGEIEAVILMSPRSAHVFSTLLKHHDLTHTARRLVFFCLSEAVAHQLKAIGAQRVAVAKMPNLQEMLCLVANGAAGLQSEEKE